MLVTSGPNFELATPELTNDFTYQFGYIEQVCPFEMKV